MRRPNRFVSIVAIAVFSLVSALSLWAADEPPSISAFAAKGFPDNADLRGKLFSYVIGASKDIALAYGERQLQSTAGPVTVREERRNADFIVEFLNPSVSGTGTAGRGSCYIQRSNAKGNYILQARIQLEDDPSCFLALYPSGSGTRGDVVMYGAAVKRGLYFSDMIYRILLLSFSDIVDATGRSFDWSIVFKFGIKGAEGDYAAELRSALAGSQEASEQAASASAAPIALGASPSKVSLAAAPSLPSLGGPDLVVSGPRSLRIASSIDRASSVEALLLDLAASGEAGARELAIAPDGAPAFVDDRGDPLAKPAYTDFPRYDARGLSLAAVKAALFLDLQSNTGSVYALVGEGLHALVIPAFDEAGRLEFSVFSGGKEVGWDDLLSGRRDLRARVLRVPS